MGARRGYRGGRTWRAAKDVTARGRVSFQQQKKAHANARHKDDGEGANQERKDKNNLGQGGGVDIPEVVYSHTPSVFGRHETVRGERLRDPAKEQTSAPHHP